MLAMYETTTAGEAIARPGIDTRQWASFGTVDADTPGQRSVEFSPQYGPLISVTLQPSGVPCRCRVAGIVAGTGEAEYTPFVGGDEVIVAIPEGDEAYATIIGRLSNEIDQWPTTVAGQDVTQNNVAFRRQLAPYIFELGGGYLVRNSTTKAFFSIRADGTITLSDANNAWFTMTPSLIGFQDGSAKATVQIDVEGGTGGDPSIVLATVSSKLVIDPENSSFYTPGALQLGTFGAQAAWHATSVESVVGFFSAFLHILGAASAPGGAAGAAALATFLFGFSNVPTTLAGEIAALIAAAAALPLDPAVSAAIQTALQIPAVPGTKPGVGAPGLIIG